MTTTTITKEKLNLFVVCGKHYVSSTEESELTAAVEAVLDPAIKKLKKVEREKDVIRLSLAKKSHSKHIERDKHGQLQYTEADQMAVINKLGEIDEQEVTIPTDIVEKFPSDGLSYDIRQAFEGIVIPKIERKFDSLPEDEEPSSKDDE